MASQKVIKGEHINVKRRLGLLSCVCFIVGTIIGSGIFISPTGVLRQSGSVALCMVVWTVCGLISMCCALVYVELASLIPKSGAEHGYFLETFGTFPAFIYIWAHSVAIQPGSTVVKCLTLAEYLSPVLYDECGPPEYAKKIIAATTLLTISITNSLSVRLTAKIQIMFTFIKVAGLVVIIVGGIFWIINKGNFGSLETGFEGTTTKPENIALAIYSGLWAYDGWGNLNMVVEEIEKPKRNIPLAVCISIGVVTLVYLMVNVSYLAVLDKEEFLSSWAVGVSWGEQILGPAVILIPIVVASSVYGSLNGGMFNSARLMFSGGREGHLPEVFSYINVNSRIPVPSIVWNALVGFLMLIPGNIGNLLNLLNFLIWLFYGLSMVTVIILRFRMKDAKRSVKVPLVIPGIILLICIYLTVAPFLTNSKIEFLYALAFLGLGVILFFPFVFFKLQVPAFCYVTSFIQMLMEVVPTSGYRDT